MVISALKYQPKRRGRPSKRKPSVDLGTPEQQQKRNTLLSFLNTQQKISPITTSKALSGSFLHQLFCFGHIDQDQLRIGLICQKTFRLAFRSMEIHSQLKSAYSRLGTIRCYEKDLFENKEIEEKWKKLRKILFKLKHDDPLKKEIIGMILSDEGQDYGQILFLSSDFVHSLQSILDEIGKMINKLGIKKFKTH
jgi:hypothetical protein